jgi:hypothetical protein
MFVKRPSYTVDEVIDFTANAGWTTAFPLTVILAYNRWDDAPRRRVMNSSVGR